jgi:hypothetical protein
VPLPGRQLCRHGGGQGRQGNRRQGQQDHRRLADANDSLKGAINVADFNDEEKLGKGKEMVDRLTKLVAIFEGLDFGSNRAEGDDLLGDAYEYLMRHFATESGKSKGQFYTPAEVSRTMAMVIDLGQGHHAATRPSTTPPAAPARCCSRRTTKPRAAPGWT